MGRNKITEEIMLDRAKSIVSILRDADGWVSTLDLRDISGLSIDQIKGAVKYERRWFLKCPEKCGTTYILSGPHGYKLPKTLEDYIDMYKSLYSWGISVLVTISPMGKYLKQQGVDVQAIRKEAMENANGDPSVVGGIDSWH